MLGNYLLRLALNESRTTGEKWMVYDALNKRRDQRDRNRFLRASLQQPDPNYSREANYQQECQH